MLDVRAPASVVDLFEGSLLFRFVSFTNLMHEMINERS